MFLAALFFGRLWCGWACPETVFLDHVFRRVERLIDGDAPSRRKLEKAGLPKGIEIEIRYAEANPFPIKAKRTIHIG